MWPIIETVTIYTMVLGLWVGVPLYVFLKLRSRRTPGRMKADPVDTNLPRVQRERVTEIDAEHGTDYRGPGRKGEPFFSPGGFLGLLGLVATMVGLAVYQHYGWRFLYPIVHPISVFLTGGGQ